MRPTSLALAAVFVLSAACFEDAPPPDVTSPRAPATDARTIAGDPVAPAAVPATASGAPYPVVLLHGMAGFVKVVGAMPMEYFTGVVEDLSAHGESAFVTLAPPFAASEARVPSIVAQVDEILKKTGKARVNLIGHSQGGLDARVMASPAGLHLGAQIASVTSVATPHHGSRIADFVLGFTDHLPDRLVDKGTDIYLGAIERRWYEVQTDPAAREQAIFLSEKHMTEEFNPKYADDPNVVYLSWTGRTNEQTGTGVCDDGEQPNDPSKVDRAELSAGLFATSRLLENGEGKVNDGMTTVESAKWGKFQGCVPADHFEEVLGGRAFDQIAFFRQVVARIRREGL